MDNNEREEDKNIHLALTRHSGRKVKRKGIAWIRYARRFWKNKHGLHGADKSHIQRERSDAGRIRAV